MPLVSNLCLQRMQLAMRRFRLRFSLQFLFLLMTLSSLPMSWVTKNLTEHRKELACLARIREKVPDLDFRRSYHGPSWAQRTRLATWLYRVDAICLSNLMYAGVQPSTIPLDFCDTDLAAIDDDLRNFKHLKRLSMSFTDVSDESASLLRQYTHLESLNLQETSMTPPGVERLQQELSTTRIVYSQYFRAQAP